MELSQKQLRELNRAKAGDFSAYDKVIIAFSGGKDSQASTMKLLDLGCPPEQMYLWHHDVEGGATPFFDWPCTSDYCCAAAEQLEIDLYFSWKEGGFRRELLRDNEPTAPTSLELVGGGIARTGGKGPKGTRRRFPAIAADLTRRWCSAYLKIDVGDKIFANDPTFARGFFLFVTGERREESPGRAKYLEAENDRASTRKRIITHWRPVIDFPEKQVWDTIKNYGVNPHPAYHLGFGRLSCAACIFGNPDQWATVRELFPEQFAEIAEYEVALRHTLRDGTTLPELADRGTSYLRWLPHSAAWAIEAGRSHQYNHPITTDPWECPTGAFKKGGGPT